MLHKRWRLIWLEVCAIALQRLGQLRQQRGHLAGDLGADAGGVQAVGVGPDAAQAVLHLGPGQVGQLQAVAARVGVGGVGAAGFAELGIHLDHGAHIDHQHKGRAAIGCGQGARIGLALAAGAQQAVVKALGVAAGLEFFGLQHKVAAPVAVNAAGAGAAVAMGKGDRALEHVGLLGRGVGLVHAEQLAQVHHKALCGGQLAGGVVLPALDEGVGGGGVNGGGGCGGGRGHAMGVGKGVKGPGRWRLAGAAARCAAWQAGRCAAAAASRPAPV